MKALHSGLKCQLVGNRYLYAPELHAGRAGPQARGSKTNLRAARAAYDPTAMTTDLSCFSLLRVRNT